MIKPTVGRIVLFRFRDMTVATDFALIAYNNEPMAAIVASVREEKEGAKGYYLNLCVLDHAGYQQAVHAVRLVQDGEAPPTTGRPCWCEWMPYQKAVAAGEIPPTLHAVDVVPKKPFPWNDCDSGK